VPALVSADVFAAAQQQLERNRKLAQRNATLKRYMLQGLVVCSRCGYAYYGKSMARQQKHGRHVFLYYRCTGTDSNRFVGGAICKNRPLRVDQLEQYVWSSIRELLEDPSRLEHEWSQRAASPHEKSIHESRRIELAAVIAAHERALRRLVDAYEAGAVELKDLKLRTDAVKSRLERIRAELRALDHSVDEAKQLTAVVARLRDFALHVRTSLDDLSWDDRKQLIRTLVSRIEIDHDEVTVVYRVAGPAPTTAGKHRDGTRTVGRTPQATPTLPPSPEVVDCVRGVLSRLIR
jgi:site-specific DNA recombinase